ncbi:hypothetical protein N7495_008403 [Penicillium taxi]|uniref:uncharacterized protein n=1 Tax=Penicillium taxi TaxID=168475 RepID=UPI00254579CB|nr:uncharacterized protein N7495_008403 [Penicillium taxi]KAJ5888362.1 hypothetical protein N7495_008403 [Penicillium taxi]
MPGVKEMSSSVGSPETLLRSHKPLPRGIMVSNVDVAQPVSPDINGYVAAPAPPLTPPGARRDEVSDKLTYEINELILTPRRPSIPPTPDVTPPRTTSLKQPPANHLLNLSSSPRADSFQTACENISDGDMNTPVRSCGKGSHKTRQRGSSCHQSPVGAELTYSKDLNLSASNLRSESGYETGFESFDGEWAATPTPAGKLKSSVGGTRDQTVGQDRSMLDVRKLEASLIQEKSLRDRVHNTHQLHASPSLEHFRKDIGWPSDNSPVHGEKPVSRRHSVISSTSTIEAMIIDSPKRAQRLLRHTEKRSSLRSVSSPMTGSEPTSTTSNPDYQRRLTHKAGRISEQDRRSISSDVAFAAETAANATHPLVDVIPVVVIPERRSSLKGVPDSNEPSRSGSKRSSRRPPDTSIVPRHRIRTVSESISAPPKGRESMESSRGRASTGPAIPTRSSSLSARTSRNNSRATSLTSESLRSHTLAMDMQMQKLHDQQRVSPLRIDAVRANKPHGHGLLGPPNLPALINHDGGNGSNLRPPSFPQCSIPSSSPGLIEIREATAVSLTTHNNRSLLLVDQGMPVTETRTLQAFFVEPEISDRPVNAHTPDNPIQCATVPVVESPLKNPRPPPNPLVSQPLSQFSMETVSAAASKDNLGFPARRWSSIRRPWAARTRSDSFQSVAKSLSVKSARNRTAGMEMDSRLYPFWRPRGFWEDVPNGSPKKSDSSRQSLNSPGDSTDVSNRLVLPQSQLVFDGLPSVARHNSPIQRGFYGRRYYNAASKNSLIDRGFLSTTSPLYQHPSYPTISRWRTYLRSISLRNVRNRLRRIRYKRLERKRGMQRETLKQSISSPFYVASGPAFNTSSW